MGILVIGAVFVICGIVLHAISDGNSQDGKEVMEDE